MKETFKDFPICINCKYYIDGPCGLTMIDPVTGKFENRRNRQAAAYRKENNPCGPAGIFFKPGKNKVEPGKKPDVIKEVKESTAKVIEVEVPDIVAESSLGNAELVPIEQTREEAPKRRKSRSKQAE